MKIHCPHCGVKGSAEDSYSGRKVKCPKCTTIFIVKPDVAVSPSEDLTAVSEMDIETDSPALQEKSLDWADIASEIDLHLTEEETGDDNRENLTSTPAEPDDVIDDFAEPGEEIDLSSSLEEQAIPDDKGQKSLPGDEIEEEPYGVDTEQCWQCGKKDTGGEPFIEQDDHLYCIDCVPLEEFNETGGVGGAVGAGLADDVGLDSNFSFSIKALLREAWEQTKGAKGSIWAGSAVMYFVVLSIVAGGAYLLPAQSTELPGITEVLITALFQAITDGVFALPSADSLDITGMLSTALFQAVTDCVFALFTAGLLYLGIRKVAGDMISWKMTFQGFSCAGKIIIATVLQTILISVGFLLLILPGIYLVVGYSMTMPLIVDKGLSPWEALETSRKAIHKVWWKVAGLLLVMGLLFVVALIPLGIGLIWIWPMFIILAGVVYRYLFGVE